MKFESGVIPLDSFERTNVHRNVPDAFKITTNRSETYEVRKKEKKKKPTETFQVSLCWLFLRSDPDLSQNRTK